MRSTLLFCALALAVGASGAVPSSERDALVALYQSAGGSGWTNRTNWLGAPGTECTWYGVECDENQSHVRDLALYDNNLDGTLPADLRKLTALRSAQFWQNELRGALPPELGELAQLETLYLQNNQFSGTIPASWGALKKLVRLGLDGNALEGTIPPQIGDMTALEELGLSVNRLGGTIPKELGNLTRLTFLSLTDNRLEGAIPRELANLRSLEIASLALNSLSGAIPPELENLAAIHTLDLSYNRLTGGIPATLGNLKTIEELDLANNPLGGTIPGALGNLSSIKRLFLTDADLTGTIPDEIFRLTTLEELNLGGNLLRGPISPNVANLANLQVLALYSNAFEGAIPPAIVNMNSLRSLELQDNALTGAIPPDLSRLANLEWLDLSGNRLAGRIPPQLASLAKLRFLALYENQLEGAIPGELGQLGALATLALSGNQLTGTIPDGLRSLRNLASFTAHNNQLTGSIPSWIGDLASLRELFLGDNRLTGAVPAGLASLDLTYLDLADNQLVGPFPDISRMRGLLYLTVGGNQLTGPLPAALGELTELYTLDVSDNQLTGPLPRALGALTNLEYVDLANNHFDGAIPPELGGLAKAYALSLSGNRLSGTIPKELGDLASLQFLDLSFNALRGPVPREITKLVALEDARSDFSYNALFASDAEVRAFLNDKQYDADFEATQTVTPANVRVAQITDRNATLTWTPIRYHYDGGGYQVVVSTSRGGAPVAVATTASKEFDTITVRNLRPATQYFFTVSTVTHPHDYQKNLIVSDASPGESASTAQFTPTPADVDITEHPTGMVQIDGAEVVSDRFTVTNFGDVATTLTLERGGDFFTVAPESFSLGAGASQTVTLRSIGKPAGTYYGHVVIRGNGAPNDLIAYTVLLSTSRPAGTVIALPLATRVEVAGAAGSDSVGTAQFRNGGNAALTGIVLSDQPWVEPSREPITIEPGAVGTVNFRVVRARRPAAEGTLTAELRLVYVSGGGFLQNTTGVSVSIVTVVDTTRPSVTTSPLPPLAAGELALLIPGMRSSGATRSDLALLNRPGSRSINDLRLYFTRGSETRVAALQPLAAARALHLENLVGNIYATDGTGTLQVRTRDWESVAADAKVSVVTAEGTRAGALPVFRGDRAASAGQAIYLTGLAAPGDLLLQETDGAAALARVVYLDAAGRAISTRDATLTAWELIEWNDAVPANAATAVVTAAAGSLHAYARLRDASGDVWSVVDWSRFYRYPRTDSVRVPFADGRAPGGKRRAARHDTTPNFDTALALFNSGAEEARVRVDVIETSGRASSREVTIAPGATLLLSDAGSPSGTSTAHLVVAPLRGEIVASARSASAALGGTAVPVLSASSGLRLGQSQIFSALEDSAVARTGYGFVETSGAPVTVRARIFLEGGATSLVTAVTERDFVLAPSEQIVLPELLRSFAGNDRNALGDQRNLVLEIEVIAGSGSVIPFVIATDAGTGDPSLRLQ